MAKVISAENIFNPMVLNSAGEPEVIILAGKEMKPWHLNVIKEAGIDSVKLVIDVPVTHIAEIEDDLLTY